MYKKAEKNWSLKKSIYCAIKRAFDIICSILGLIFLIPISIIVKLLYVFSGDFHSIFLVQKRIGQYGKEFNFLKYRTMVKNADEILEKMLREDSEARREYKKNKKFKNDPRITKAGALIRKLSIDELPQLINIFIGNMSMIGNRPYLPREKEDMGKFFDTIVSTKPGLTGYWQVSGRSDVSFKRRLKLEKYYSENCSIKMDIKIFFKTFKVVFCGDGAK